jgi:ElaB/YqjD/DUF883 family membrane-anchored ribosome-binding protein
VGKSPEQLRREIEQTRAELGGDLDQLTEKVSPSSVVNRRVDAAKSKVTGVKDRVMGSAHDVKETGAAKANSAGGTVGDKASDVADSVSSTVSNAPQATLQRAQGNPLAAGIIAFGLGWLASTLIPASSAEQQAAQQLSANKDKLLEPLKETAKQAATEVKDELQPQVQEAVSSVQQTAQTATSEVQSHATDRAADVKDTASSAGQEVSSHAQSAAQEVKGQAQQSASEVQDTAQTRAQDVRSTSGQ